jgi:hypothetical protein
VSFGRSTVRLASDQNQKKEFKNKAQGKMIATSVRGIDWQRSRLLAPADDAPAGAGRFRRSPRLRRKRH